VCGFGLWGKTLLVMLRKRREAMATTPVRSFAVGLPAGSACPLAQLARWAWHAC